MYREASYPVETYYNLGRYDLKNFLYFFPENFNLIF